MQVQLDRFNAAYYCTGAVCEVALSAIKVVADSKNPGLATASNSWGLIIGQAAGSTAQAVVYLALKCICTSETIH
jgi:hypothetical protein